MVAYWQTHFHWESNVAADEVTTFVIDDIITRSKKKAKIMPGLLDLLKDLKVKGYKCGLATSSPQYMMEELIHYFNLQSYFQHCQSAELESHGKPHPAVFLSCAQYLKSEARECLALEDSINGMIAARAAMMKVIVVPDPIHYERQEWSLAQAKLKSLKGILSHELFQLLTI